MKHGQLTRDESLIRACLQMLRGQSIEPSGYVSSSSSPSSVTQPITGAAEDDPQVLDDDPLASPVDSLTIPEDELTSQQSVGYDDGDDHTPLGAVEDEESEELVFHINGTFPLATRPAVLSARPVASRTMLEDVYADLKDWVEEREAVRLRKDAGTPLGTDAATGRPIWTHDPILASARMCNVHRHHDRVSQWIIHHIIERYPDHQHLWLMLAIGRFVNWPPALQELQDQGAWPDDGPPDWARMASVMDARMARREKTWSSAYRIPTDQAATARTTTHPRAHDVFLTFLGRELISVQEPIQAALQTHTQRAVHAVLHRLHGWGGFLSGQVVADYALSRLLPDATDRDTWAPLGPGSQQGLNRLFGRPIAHALTQERAVVEMITLRTRLVDEIPWASSLSLMDCQNVLCETAKYVRYKRGEGTPKSHYQPETAY